MPQVVPGINREGLRASRLLMVLSSMSPLFILWAIRGSNLIPDGYFITFCVLMVAVPNTFLWLRVKTAKNQGDVRELTVGTATDHRDHVLTYLFAMLLPLYSVALGSWRNLAASLAALAFIAFLFWHLNLHYMNLLFAACGFRVFTVHPPVDGNPLTGKSTFVIITRRIALASGDRLTAYRLSNTVYLEARI